MGKTYKHTIDLLIDAIEVQPNERARLNEAVETAGKLAAGTCKVIVGDQEYTLFFKSYVHCVCHIHTGT